MVGERLALGGAVEDEAKELALTPAAVEAIDELIQVALEVLPADSVEGATDPGLEIGEDRVDPGRDEKSSPKSAS